MSTEMGTADKNDDSQKKGETTDRTAATAVETAVLHDERARLDREAKEARLLVDNPDGSKSYKFADGRELVMTDKGTTLVLPGTPPRTFVITNLNIDIDKETVSYSIGPLSFTESPDKKTVFNARTNTLSVYDPQGNLLSRNGNPERPGAGPKAFQAVLHTGDVPGVVARAGERIPGVPEEAGLPIPGIDTLPPEVQASAKVALADLTDGKVIPGVNLEIAFNKAAQSGRLNEFVNAINKELREKGIPYSLAPIGGGKSFTLRDGNGQTIRDFGPFEEAAKPVVVDGKRETDPRKLYEEKARLEDEVKRGNKEAVTKLKAIETQLNMIEIERFGAPDSVKKLLTKALEGNESARAALASILVPQSKAEQWQKAVRTTDGTTSDLPDLSKLTEEQRRTLKLAAISALGELSAKGAGLSSSECAALGMAFTEAAQDKDSPKTGVAIKELLDKTLNKATAKDSAEETEYARRTEKILTGLYAAIRATDEKTPGLPELLALYGKAASSENNKYIHDYTDRGAVRLSDIGRSFDAQLQECQTLARSGDRKAIEMLAMMAGGVGKYNSKVNEEVTDETKGTRKPGDALSKRASAALLDIAKGNPEHRQTIMDVLSSDLQINKLADKACKIETLGRIAAMDHATVPDKVLQSLRGALDIPELRDKAVLAMLRCGAKLNAADMSTLAKHITPDTVAKLRDTVGDLSPERATDFANALSRRVADPKLNAEERALAIKALAAVGSKHETLDSLSALRQFGGKAGREALEAQLREDKYSYPTDKDVKEAADKIQTAAAEALLQITEQSTNERMKSEAFRAFATTEWDVHRKSCHPQDYKNRLETLMRNNPENVAIQGGVPKLVLDLNREKVDAPGSSPDRAKSEVARLAAAFADRGALTSDEGLKFLTEKAVEAHGADQVRKVLDRIALFNALSPEMRMKLSGSEEPMRDGQRLSLSGRKLPSEIINQLPEDVRLALTGSKDRVSKEWKAKEGDGLTSAQFNSLTPELRKALTATDKPVAADLVLGLLANKTIENPQSVAHVLYGKPPLEERVGTERKAASDRVKYLESELTELIRMKESGLKNMHKHAEKGVGFLEKMKADPTCRAIVIHSILGPAAGTVGSLIAENSGIKWDEAMDKFKADQEKYLGLIGKNLEPLIERQYSRIQEAQTSLLSVELAVANQEYVKLVSSGHTRQADQYAIDTYAKYGQATLALAPDIAKTFMPQGEGIHGGTLRRLHASGDSQFPVLVINPFTGSDKRTSDTSPSKGFERGLELLAAIKPAEGRSDYAKAEKGSYYADAPLLRREALAGIDQSPELHKLNTLAHKLNEQLSSLNTEIGIMKSGGDRFKSLIDDANKRAKLVQQALDGLSPAELARLREMRDVLDKSLKGDTIKDPEARKEIEKRLASLNQGLMLFDKDFDVEKHQPEKFRKLKELQKEYDQVKGSWNLADTDPIIKDPRFTRLCETYDLAQARARYWVEIRKPELETQLRELRGELYQRKNLESMVRFLDDPKAKDETDFRAWAKRDGVELAISTAFAVGATAAIIASYGTATPGVLALAAGGTVGAMAGREVAKGILLAQGVNSHGSTAYEWWNKGTVEDKDGSDRRLGLMSDVLPEYGTELVVGTGIGIAGSIVGSAIGQGLRSMAPKALKVFLSENLPALTKLNGNIDTINKAAASSGWFGRFGAAALKEGGMNLALTPASMAAEHGISAAVRHMKLAVDDGNMLTSFLAAAAVSIPFGMMHPSVHPRKGAFKPGDPHLSLGFKGSPADVNHYINNAHERGSVIKIHPSGGFTEVTKEGLVVRWSRDTTAAPVRGAAETIPPGGAGYHRVAPGAVAGADHPAGPIRPSVTHGGADVLPPGTRKPGDTTHPRVEIDPSLRRTPGDLARMHAEMTKLMEPVKDAYAKVTELDRSFREREAALTKKLNECPNTAKGDADAATLGKQIREEKLTYNRERKTLQENAEKLRTSIAASDDYRKLHIASSLAEGKFPSGVHKVKLPDGDTVTLVIGMDTVVEDGKLVRKPSGCTVPQQHVDEIIRALQERGIRPEQVTIRTEYGSTTEGSLTQHGRTYEISINSAHKEVRMTFNHETGHLYDLEHFRKSAPEAVRTEVHKAYLEGVSGDLAATAAQHLGETPSAAFKDDFMRKLASSDDVYNHEIKTPQDYQRYLACKSEVFAEMHKLYQENRRIVAEGGKALSYAELVERFTSPHNRQRGEMMKPFEKMYNVLNEKVFPTIPEGGSLPRGKFVGPARDVVLPSKLPPPDAIPSKGGMQTDYSSINRQVGEVKNALDGHVNGKTIDAAGRDAFMTALSEALKKADPKVLEAIGEKLKHLASASDLPQRLAQLTEILNDPRTSRMGPQIEKLLDPKMPARNLESLSEFLKTDAVKHVFGSGDARTIQQFRENLNKLAHSPELPERVAIAKQLESLFKDTNAFRMDFVLDSNLPVAKLRDFTVAMESMNKGDWVFANAEVVQTLRSAHPEAARHLVESLPEMVKKFSSADAAVDQLTALRTVADSCRDVNGLMDLPSLLQKNRVHLQESAGREFVDKSMKAGLEHALANPDNNYLFSTAGDRNFQQLRKVYESRGLLAEFNQTVRDRFEMQIKHGRKIPEQEKHWLFKNRESLGVDQAMLERVMRYEPPVPKLEFFPGGENMARVLSEHPSYEKYTGFELAGTTNNGNHLVKCADESGRTNYMIVQKGKSGEAVIFHVIDMEGSPLDPMFVKHLADMDPTVLKQMASGMYNDGSVRRTNLDLGVDVERTDSPGKKPETATVKGYGMSWRVGGGMHRTLMVVTADASGNPTIVVVSRCATKATADVDGSYKATPPQLAEWKKALADAARPGWTYKPK